MRRYLCLVMVPLGALGFLACVGDDVRPSSSAQAEAGLPGAEAGPGEGGEGPGDGSTPGADGAADADAGLACGYPGEACCAAPLAPCRTGTTCSTSTQTCLVDDAWAVGTYTVFNGGISDRTVTAHFDGVTWTRGPDILTEWSPVAIHQSSPTVVRVIANRSSDNGGKYFYLNGTASWKECGVGQTCIGPLLSAGKLPELYGITSVEGDYWLGGLNQIYRCANGASSCVSVTAGLTGTWASGNFAGTTAKDLWYSSNTRAFHYDGATWTEHPGLKARSIYQVRKDDTWVGDKTLQHWDGAMWSPEMTIDGSPAPGLISSISGSATNDLWAAGNDNNDASFAAHWDGATWSLSALPAEAQNVTTIWSPSRGEAFVVGANAGLFRWDGASAKWLPMVSPQVTAGVGETIVSPLRWVSVHGLARPRP